MSSLFNEMMEEISEKDKKIADLEAKLAESEKEIDRCNNEWTEICDGKLETINRLIEEKHELEETIKNNSHNKWLKAEAERYKNEYQSLKGYIDQLKQQLEESFTEKDVEGLIKDREEIIKFLKQQLAEKEKYIEEQEFAEYKEMFYATQELKEDCELKILELEKQCAKFAQSQNEKAIAELEKVKEYWLKHEDIGYYIDQQIKELKGEIK